MAKDTSRWFRKASRSGSNRGGLRARWSAWTYASGLVIVLAGCQGSSPLAPTCEVKGQILLADGRPLTSGRVTFVSEDGSSPPASGEVGPDGGFSLTTRVVGDGAVPGDYKVRVEPDLPPGRQIGRPRFPLKYVDEDSSGLLVTIQSEPNRLDPITLK